MVGQSKDKVKESKVEIATQGDICKMLYLLLEQNEITEDNTMEISMKAFRKPMTSKICGRVKDGKLIVWLKPSRQQKRKKEREKKKLVLPNRTLILPRKET